MSSPIRTSTAPIINSALKSLLEPDAFMWATGIEDTFICDPHRTTGRLMDEYTLTQHYENWSEDIELAASLGVRYMRYGIPWYRIEPEPGRFNFEFPDKAFERMLALGVNPIVDLMHYGTPPWLTDSFWNPDYPNRVADYAGRVAERYKGQIYWYTPLNEPRITAYYCGKIGWWPPYGRSWKGFLRVMLAVCKGIVLTSERLRQVDPEVVVAHVDATDVYTPESDEAKPAADLRQQLVFLALDLITGKVVPDHPLHSWILAHGFAESDLSWFQEHPIELDVLGLNLYPMYTNKVVSMGKKGIRARTKYADGSLLVDLAHRYYDRYRTPLFVSETASDKNRREDWLRKSLDAVKELRQEGIPMFGYTWWPLFALVGWAQRQGDREINHYLLQFGLWNLESTSDGRLERVPTKLVAKYREIVSRGCDEVGLLGGG